MINLNDLQKYHENNRIEAKKALGGLPESIWETYSSFANTTGGIILMGVVEKKNHDLHPIDLPDPNALINQFLTLVNDKRKVSKNILCDEDIRIEGVDGNKIVLINVPRASRTDRPVFIDGDVKTGTYRRNGEGDYRCTEQEVAAMLRDASAETQDRRLLTDMNLDSLNNKSVKSYKTLAGKDFDLLKIGAVRYDKNRIKRPTVAGLLMFGEVSEILKVLPNFYLDYREYLGEKNELTYRTSGMNIFDFYYKISKTIDDNINKDLKDASREALSNALIHADYYGARGLVVTKSSEQINYSNPGNFRIDLEYAKLEGDSEPRNSLLMEMFKFINAGRNQGGNIKKLYTLRKNFRIIEEFNPERTITTIFLKENENLIGDYRLRKKVLSHITDKVKISETDLLSCLGFDDDRVIITLAALEDEELIEKKGNYYRLIS